MLKDSFLALLLDPTGFINFLQETKLIQHYPCLRNTKQRTTLVNWIRELHWYMEQNALTPEQIQQAHTISRALLQCIEPNMRTTRKYSL